MAERLSEEVLARRAGLPLKPDPVTLRGRLVRLEPLAPETDAPALFAASDGRALAVGARACEAYDPDSLVWRYLSLGPFAELDPFRAYLENLAAVPDSRAFCVHDTPTGVPVGVFTLMRNVPANLCIELGNIWYGPVVQRSGVNLEATYLMLRHAFELGYRRIEWKCNSENERSRRSALRMGFQFEGIQEQHMIIKGRNRDTAWYRMLDREWPEIRPRLEALLAEITGSPPR
jgi:RimJ/RimL family protein N-acetyltransferase